jgi:hypothetical protein
MKRKLYAELALLLSAIENCRKSGNDEWALVHREKAEGLVKAYMPSGGGFDAGTHLDVSCSSADKLIFNTSFHHMTGEGFYDGWTSHDVIVTPSLAFGIEVRVSGRNRNDIKDFIHSAFHDALTLEVEQ